MLNADAFLYLDRIREITSKLPDVKEGKSYGTPGFHIKKKFFARLKEDGRTLVVRTRNRDALLKKDPTVFFITNHYKDYPAVLVRLEKIKMSALKKTLIDAWKEQLSEK